MKNEYFYKVEKVYLEIKDDIAKRLNEYKEIWDKGTNEDIHAELSFCILTPQSKARNAWKAITNMREDGVLFTGDAETLTEYLNIVRFKNNKAKYLVELRNQMTDKDGKIITKDFFEKMPTVQERRNWIVENIKGMSWKEAGHFLRNVGFGQEVAILDRHILKNLVRLQVIEEIPKTLNKKTYLEIEDKMKKFCEEVSIPMDNMDLLLWYLEAGEIFK
ncbi:N-glycosylase/DNA lyase [Fusobacterium sp.]|uniref:N-glycosylase/DNA lyase n=1 Tax=Fusobacterium sp. TaxID=68766 RepID=UPI00261D9732|nr:N-glycosylase/DNA lyase [Fusobacterium sp.]